VNCQEVISSLHNALHVPLVDSEWGFSSDDLRQRMVEAWRLRDSLNGGEITALKRVDLLGGWCKLQGFCRDE
ncbi:hypothetical protein B0H16DRAFT_1262199, partial [Mycena metata]